jgi:predicted TIM-barrel fold metal-dependent hydrolase
VNHLIDVHHHATTEALTGRMRRAGIPIFAGMPPWDADIAIAAMDSIGVTASVLSVPADIRWLPQSDRAAAARDVNDELAAIVASAPQRFGAFATIPLPDPDAAVAEIGRALDTLGLEGICMLTSYDGVYLSDPRFTGLLEELDRRGAVVFVHPILLKEPIADLPPALLEGTFDTTRFATKLAAADVFERFPGIRFILPHTGGMVPYVKWRIALNVLQGGDFRRPVSREDIDREIAKLDGLYYDTTLNLGPLHALARADRILFGTDVPWANPDVLALQRDDLITQATATRNLDAIAHGNAFALFPALARRISP